MVMSIFTCLSGKASHKKARVAPVLLKEAEEAVHIDELTKSKEQRPRKAVVVKKKVRFADSEPTILGEDHNEKEIIKENCAGNDELRENEGYRVKVRMTKEEAARFLSKCNNGGVLNFKDVASELVAIPVNRFSVISACSNNL